MSSPDGYTAMEILSAVHSFYDSAWNQLLVAAAAMLGIGGTIVGIVVPVLLERHRRRSNEADLNRIKRELEEEVSRQAVSRMTATLDPILKGFAETNGSMISMLLKQRNQDAYRLAVLEGAHDRAATSALDVLNDALNDEPEDALLVEWALEGLKRALGRCTPMNFGLHMVSDFPEKVRELLRSERFNDNANAKAVLQRIDDFEHHIAEMRTLAQLEDRQKEAKAQDNV